MLFSSMMIRAAKNVTSATSYQQMSNNYLSTTDRATAYSWPIGVAKPSDGIGTSLEVNLGGRLKFSTSHAMSQNT